MGLLRKTFGVLEKGVRVGDVLNLRGAKRIGGPLPDISATSPDVYVKNLNVLRAGLKATAAGSLSPSVVVALNEQLGRRGLANTNLGRDLASGAMTIPGLETMNIASNVAPELQELQTAVASAKAGIVPRAPTAQTIGIGAAEGFAAGGPWGALAGAVGGALKANQERTASMRMKRVIADAERLASPENFIANTNAVLGKAREDTFIEGQRQEMSAESSISERGLRGTGVGTQESISAAVLPEVAALRKAAGQGATTSRQQTTARLGTPVIPPVDRLTQALTSAGVFAGEYFSPTAMAKRRASRFQEASTIDPMSGTYTPNSWSRIQRAYGD